MMRRATALALAAALVGGLLAIPAAPAGAQNGDSMLDAPRLGFEIDHHAGNPGDLVGAQVNPDDVAEHCYLSQEDIRALVWDTERWGAPPNRPAGTAPGPLLWEWILRGPLVGIEVPPEWPVDVIIPGIIEIVQAPGAGVDDLAWTWRLVSLSTSWDGFDLDKDTPEKIAAVTLWHFFADILGGPGLAAEKQQYLDATFILTFVDPVTQELVGDLGGFDAETGAGAIDVPDLDPGLWAVAAACVEPVITDESFAAAIEAGAQWVLDNDIPIPLPNALAYSPPGEAAGWLLGQLAPIMLAELMQPRALGLDFYCILNEEGFCATPPDPVGLLAELSEEELAEFADLEAGAEGAGAGSDVDAELLTEAVTAAPSFTG